MTEGARRKCCRLCLAPDSECISILNSYAADKESLVTKIQNCVHIKVSANDGLSLRICHACISYLNSWQSFKNRCFTAQSKQRSWLESGKRQQLIDNNVSVSTLSTAASLRQQQQEKQQQQQQQQQHHQQQQHQHSQDQETFAQESNLSSSILDGITSLKKRKSLTVYPLPAIQVKDEPIDEEDYEAMKQQDESDEMVDPTLFLERHEEEGAEPYMTHIHSSIQDANNYSYDQLQLSAGSVVPERTNVDVQAVSDVREASCRACNLKFSTRANARRHERNLHPNLFELSTSATNSTPITKPTAALAAALELQRTAGDLSKQPFGGINVASGAVAPTSQRLRQQIVDSVNAATETSFDYDNPERYQDLLTDEKIVFLQQNEEFLQQYQTMTCNCCRKFYTSYKNFMAHMRKKYVTLPRNVCFNCLKLNDSKALFISHLKKRNCINLYKVMHSLIARVPSFAAAVAATTAAMPEKMRAKELLVNKIYECKLCTKHFRLKLEFRSHVYEEHADAQKKEVSPGQCGFCGLEFEDPLERKRHYNNMDCIVILRCVTCDEKFGNHQKFLDHVYAKHLVQTVVSGDQHQRQHYYAGSSDNSPGKKSGFTGITTSADESRGGGAGGASQHAAAKSQYFSRMPQACPICGQQYNNYNNVLRHMESKHPDQLPQTYKCVRCGNGYPRLSNLREHMLTVHSAAANHEKTRSTSFEYIVNADAVKAMESNTGGAAGGASGSGNGAYSGRYDYVMKDLMSITNGGTVADIDDDDDADHSLITKKVRLDTSANSSNAAFGASSGSALSNYKECPICSAIFSNNIGLSNHMRSHTAAAQSLSGSSIYRDSARLVGDKHTSGGASTSAASLGSLQAQKTPAQLFKRSLELAADRRFRRMRCRICQKRFSSKKSYRRHMLDDHQIRNVQFIKCKLCDAEFAYEKGLKVHMFKIHNTLLKDEMIIKQFECDICSIVYRTEDQLIQHKKSVHGNENAHPDDFVRRGTVRDSTAGGGVGGGGGNNVASHVSTAGAAADSSVLSTSSQLDATAPSSAPLYWYQCKYCPSNFNTNKKLAIHINSHDEFDSSDYSCKDCGNVYSGRKSLWVHRYKKHPQIAEPSECVLCRKVFFDSQMLENHIPTCNRKPITATGAVAEPHSGNNFYRHKTGDDEDDEGSRGGVEAADEQGGDLEANSSSKLKIKLPEVACTICGQRFTDQELFAKHIQVHEMELYTDNPLAAMFDTGPADPNQFYLDRVNDNGEYACDICTKTFTQMTALKVHRKWHFRGDSKQNPAEGDHSAFATSQTQSLLHPPGLQAVGLVPNPRPSRSLKRKRELKCEYCPSTFISNNNLRRHIYELHKSEISHWPEPPKIKLDEYLHCRKCAIKFETKKDWIDHKVTDARLMKPYGPFQWGCELCGEYVSRKEKLIHHIHSHLKDQVVVPVHQRQQEGGVTENNKNATEGDNYGGESNSQDSQQTEENGRDYDVDAGAKDDEHDFEDDDGGAEYANDDEEDQDDEEDDEDDESGEDEGGDVNNESEAKLRINKSASVAQSGKGTNVKRGDNIENIDDNANDGEDGNDDYMEDGYDGYEEDEDDDVDDDDDDTNEFVKEKQAQKDTRNCVDSSEVEDSITYTNMDDIGEDDDDDDDDDDDVDARRGMDRDHDYADADMDDDDDENGVQTIGEVDEVPERRARFACDLCQVFFDTQLELQKHVKIHFLNGPGSVTLTEIRAKQVNKSRSSGTSDVMTVSSS